MQRQQLQRLNELCSTLAAMVRLRQLPPVQEDSRAESAVKKQDLGSDSEHEQEIDLEAEEDQSVSQVVGSMMDNFIAFTQELDLQNADTRLWLQGIGLWEFANLPWDLWNQNIYAKTQMELLRKTEGYLFNHTKMSPQFVSEVFKLHYDEQWQLPKVTDSIMKKQFGQPATSRSYYQLKNVEGDRKLQLRWYMEKVFLLMKFDYMSKESYAPLHAAEAGETISWATILFDKIMVEIDVKDKRKAQGKSKLAPYLKALFDAANVHSIVPLKSEKPKIESLIGGKAKKRRVDEDSAFKDLTEDQIATCKSLLSIGYAVSDAREAILKVAEGSKQETLLTDSSFITPAASPQLGKSLVISRKKGLFRQDSWKPVMTVATEVTAEIQKLKSVQEDAGVSDSLKDARQVTDALCKVQHYVLAQDKALMSLQMENDRVKKQEDLHKQYQAMLHQKEQEMVKLSVEYLKEKQSMEKAQQELKDIVLDQSNQIMNHKMSLGLFKDWTNDLKEKMNTELQVLCENNVKLQVENQILLRRLGPLESMEKQVLAQEDVAVQGMLVSESETWVR